MIAHHNNKKHAELADQGMMMHGRHRTNNQESPTFERRRAKDPSTFGGRRRQSADDGKTISRARRATHAKARQKSKRFTTCKQTQRIFLVGQVYPHIIISIRSSMMVAKTKHRSKAAA